MPEPRSPERTGERAGVPHGERTADEELLAMQRIVRELNKLPAGGRLRVTAYLHERFQALVSPES